ncbi:hypothetical protein H4R33_003616 [Dimargaris cristalligena]|nr:hypothetical protein H4R33_003616 [Dimargaris cristalligena]
MLNDDGGNVDSLSRKALELVHYWMALLKHETLFHLRAALISSGKMAQGTNRQILDRPVFRPDPRGMVLVETLDNEQLYTIFPILQLAHELEVPEFHQLVKGMLGFNANLPVSDAFERVFATGSHGLLFPFPAASFKIQDDLYFRVIWYLYQQVTNVQFPKFDANSNSRRANVPISFDKIKYLFTTVLDPGNKDYQSHITRNNYAIFGIILAARKYAKYAPSHPDLVPIIHAEAAFFNRMVNWVNFNDFSDEITDPPQIIMANRQVALACLDEYYLHEAREYLIANWSYLDNIVEGEVTDLSWDFAPFEVDDTTVLDNTECPRLLFETEIVNIWEDDGFGINVIESAIPKEMKNRLKFKDPDALPDL